jgi:eukaryotic-like serine/threonine-protein kinase
MNIKVILKIVEGSLAGREYEFDEPATCMIGREDDCKITIPDLPENKGVSRHHCLLDIVPPRITIRDLGSSNGTWINEVNIASPSVKTDTPREKTQAETILHDGDTLRIGRNVIKIQLVTTQEDTLFYDPNMEKTAEKLAETSVYPPSLEKTGIAASLDSPCGFCGKNLSYWINRKKASEAVCPACQNNPVQIVRYLLEEAARGEKTLASMEGYAISKILGEGGMGMIFYLEHKKQKAHPLVLKLMKPHVASDETSKKRFIRECWITQFLKHPNIVRQYDHGCYEGYIYFTLEFCNLGDVRQWMDETRGVIPVRAAVPLVLEALEGLHYGHTFDFEYGTDNNAPPMKTKGLVHRDIKPSNILLSGNKDSMTAKIADFGLAKAFNLAGLSNCTQTGLSAGTPAFISRQQIMDFKHVSIQVDIWSMAATLYFMITGKYPRDFPDQMDPYLVVAESDPVPVLKRSSSVPVKLAKVLDAALLDKGSPVFPSALDFRKALQDTQ